MTPKSIFTTLFLLGIFSLEGYAQKMPNVQQTNLWAPANVKIDGYATEWGQLKAHNNATDISYTIANDDHKLYVIVQSSDHNIINKILGGGVVFTVNASGKNDTENAIAITYPVLDYHNRVWVNIAAKPEIISGSNISNLQADSFMNNNNKRFADKSKLIRTKGIKGVDTLISIYNQDGISANARFDNKMVYTYELSVELKQLGITADKPAKLFYNIKLPGVDLFAVFKAAGLKTTVITDQRYVVTTGRIPGVSDQYLKDNAASLPPKVTQEIFTSSTDFWGEYILANK